MILNKTRANILLQKIISLKLQLNIVPRDYNIANLCRKEIKQNMTRKKIILKGNITTTYIEYKHKNTVLIQPPSELKNIIKGFFWTFSNIKLIFQVSLFLST